MKMRIGLFTPITAKKKGTTKTTTTTYVEVTAATELVEKLTALGAKRVGLLNRDRLGTTKLEGDMFAVEGLQDKHLEWVVTPPAGEFQTRGIYYDLK
jgi:hypothetical protein